MPLDFIPSFRSTAPGPIRPPACPHTRLSLLLTHTLASLFLSLVLSVRPTTHRPTHNHTCTHAQACRPFVRSFVRPRFLSLSLLFFFLFSFPAKHSSQKLGMVTLLKNLAPLLFLPPFYSLLLFPSCSLLCFTLPALRHAPKHTSNKRSKIAFLRLSFTVYSLQEKEIKKIITRQRSNKSRVILAILHPAFFWLLCLNEKQRGPPTKLCYVRAL